MNFCLLNAGEVGQSITWVRYFSNIVTSWRYSVCGQHLIYHHLFEPDQNLVMGGFMRGAEEAAAPPFYFSIEFL